ncbi:HAD-IA family hydrolase [Microbacterium aerolatum]|uniref:HAD-IA family hydrolase n=1 Tax=Microbacterium aerolatum TaxID=153731 RepID=UPI0020005E56|nr:HAD-IA family hydrolase [Microbacterium aerolatum]MCK3769828.1 HAD-IA family hydrolase [Microbacterium aerolatum]
MLRAVLFDLDGVIRHFATDHIAAVEQRHSIEPGTIARFAFADDVLEPVITGVVTRAAWIEQIGAHLGNARAAVEWGRTPSEVDWEMIRVVKKIRGAGWRTAILTNGTDTVEAEVDALGLTPYFDHVFNSARLGFAKPDRRAFQRVLDRLELPAAEVFFTDDSPSKLAGAEALGMPTHHFRGAPDLRTALRILGIDA